MKKYNEKLIKTYLNIRNSFTNNFSEEITFKDNMSLYILFHSLKHYFNIDGLDEEDE